MKVKNYSLALGGGYAKGLSHIGVIKYRQLIEKGYEEAKKSFRVGFFGKNLGKY